MIKKALICILIMMLIIRVGIFLLTLISLNKIKLSVGAGFHPCPIKNIISVVNTNKPTYKILVDVEESKLYLFENGKKVKDYKCSGGKWNTPSPIGTWKITSKAKWGEGFGRKLYGP